MTYIENGRYLQLSTTQLYFWLMAHKRLTYDTSEQKSKQRKNINIPKHKK